MRFKVANYSRLEIRLDTLHIYSGLYTYVRSRVCTYAVLEAMSQADAITENSTPYKCKTVKDIEKPAGIYHHVAESSCCPKFYKNRLTHFRGQTGEVWVLFTYKHTNKQTNSFNSPTGYKYGPKWTIKCSKHVVSGAEVPFWGSQWWSITFRVQTPKTCE